MRSAALEWAVRCEEPRQAAGWAAWSGRPAARGTLGTVRAEVEQVLGAALGPPRLDRLYFGSEFCPRRLPSLPGLHRFLQEAAALGLATTFLTPLCADADFERLAPLLRLLEEQAPGSEVVFQDWGVLGLLQRDHPGLVPVLGRTLVRMLRDPRAPAGGVGRSDLALPAFRAFLEKRGVERVEVDSVSEDGGLDFRAVNLEAHLCLPFTFVASSRTCAVGSLGRPAGEKFLPGGACRQECRRSVCELKAPSLSRRVFQRGNTALALQPFDLLGLLPQVVLRCGIRRLVYDPEAGF